MTTMVYKGARTVWRATRTIGWYLLEVVAPFFGIPRPWNYLAVLVWLYFAIGIVYGIITGK